MKRFFTILIITLFTSLNSYAAYFSFNKQTGTFNFFQHGEIFITPIEPGDYSGFGYYLNGDYSTFYEISEADLNKALAFNQSDSVEFVRKHKNNAIHKTTLWKADKEEYSNNIYKIGGKGNGNIKFMVKSFQPSGQPLPGIVFTFIFGGLFLGGLFFRKYKRNKN
jgi:hypothetical protein